MTSIEPTNVLEALNGIANCIRYLMRNNAISLEIMKKGNEFFVQAKESMLQNGLVVVDEETSQLKLVGGRRRRVAPTAKTTKAKTGAKPRTRKVTTKGK